MSTSERSIGALRVWSRLTPKSRKTLGSLVLLAVIVVIAVGGSIASGATTRRASGPSGTVTRALSTFSQNNFLPNTGSDTRKDYYDPIFDYLLYTTTGSPTKLLPGLATKWSVSKDGRVWTFTLRHVNFNEGWGAVTARDVKFSFYGLSMNKTSQSAYAAPLRSAIAGIRILNKYKVQFILTRPFPDFGIEFASNAGFTPIWSERYVAKVGFAVADHNPVGSGPYVLTSMVPDSKIVLTAVKNNWRLTPEFEHIEFLDVPDPATRASLAKTGQVDITDVNFTLLPSLKGSSGRAVVVPGAYTTLAIFGGLVASNDPRYHAAAASSPLSKLAVREALNLAVNRAAIVKSVYAGYAKAATVPDQYPGWGALKAIPYDPARAKTLLAQAGYPNGFSLKGEYWTLDPGEEMPLLMQVIASDWAAIGVTLSLQQTQLATFIPTWSSGATVDTVFPHRYPVVNDDQAYMEIAYKLGGKLPVFGSQKLESLVVKLEQTYTEPARTNAFKAITNYLYSNYASVPIAVADSVYWESSRVKWVSPESEPTYTEYAQHVPSLNLPRAFTP